jgi:SAM-dependent methyltransferase
MFSTFKRLFRATPARAAAPALAVGTGGELSCFGRYEDALAEGRGLEIGGPSQLVFGAGGIVPVYSVAAAIDNCNFAQQTLWEDGLQEGTSFVFNEERPAGRQFIAEATRLEGIADASYDYLLSSHCIEHLANPLQGMVEWRRVLKPGGLLFLVVPHKDGTFDHRRPVTALAHLRQDFEAGTTEADLTHLEEILALHDLAADPGAGSAQAFRERALLNAQNRGLHQHVFDTWLAVDVVDWAQLQIEAVEPLLSMHIVIVARKPAPGEAVDNQRFRADDPAWASPFPSDARMAPPAGIEPASSA